jgi:tetratricopeptide (TPR) repeat protein
LNYLGRYQEAYTQAQQLYDIHKPLKHKDNKIFADIYIEMARSQLGLGKIDKAYEYINNAISILLVQENLTPERTNYSKIRA